MVVLTISIPAYNDGPSIEKVVDEALQAGRHLGVPFEILVINDGSKDDTQERVLKLQERVPELRYRLHPVNLGFGPTIAEVYISPTSEWVWFIPGDGQVPADGVLELWKHKDKADFLLARRAQRQDTGWRWFVSYSYNWSISIVAGRRIRDVNAAGLVRKSTLADVTLRSQSAFVHAELLLEILRSRGRLLEVPVPHRAREFGVGSGNRWRVILTTARDLWMYSLDRRLGIPWWRRRPSVVTTYPPTT
jgi:glycosyltransferase involved in cell wall biosynthesis